MFTNQLFKQTINEAVDEQVFFKINDPELYDTVAEKFYGKISWHGEVLAVSRATWSRIKTMTNNMGFDTETDLEQVIDEVTVIHDNPEDHRNPSVQPDGGIGTWNVNSLRTSLTRQLEELSKMINTNAQGVDYMLYRAGAIQSKIEALAKTEKYLEKLGRRKVAKNKVVDLK
jgi:hypothetical protein